LYIPYTDEYGAMIKGQVVAYSSDVSAGVIRTADRNRVFFSRKDWMSATPPSAGQNVVLEQGPDKTLKVFFENDSRAGNSRTAGVV
jgi:hypothetical protein